MLVKFWSVRVMVLKYKREMNSERDSNILEIRGKAELPKGFQAKYKLNETILQICYEIPTRLIQS